MLEFCSKADSAGIESLSRKTTGNRLQYLNEILMLNEWNVNVQCFVSFFYSKKSFPIYILNFSNLTMAHLEPSEHLSENKQQELRNKYLTSLLALHIASSSSSFPFCSCF